MLTRCAISGTGIVLGLIFVLAHLPFLFLILPVAVVFLGIVADPEETHAVWYGMLHTLGIFDGAALAPAERVKYAEKKHYFWFGEVSTAAALAAAFTIPLGIFLSGMTEITLAFISAAVLFLPLFVFLPKVIQRGMKADIQAVIDTFGKNGQVKKVFWAVFTAMAGLVVARIIDPGTARQVVQVMMGMGV
jgi:hypothetical protein